MNRQCLVFWVLVFLCARPLRAVSLTPEDVIANIALTEKGLLNLKVEATTTGKERLADENNWEDDGDGKLTAWFIGAPGSKMRVDYDELRTRWAGGPIPFMNEKTAQAFDGRVQRHLWLKSGIPERPNLSPHGEVQGERFLGFEGFASGWHASIYGAMDDSSHPGRVSDYLIAAAKIGRVKETVTEETYNGRAIVLLSIIASGSVAENWYFDPTRAFALLRRDVFSGGKLSQQINVTAISNPAPGVYYPTTAARNDFRDGVPWRVYTFHATSVTVNDPHFSDDIFTLQWPANTAVHDKISNTNYTISGDSVSTTQSLTDQARDAQQMATTAPAATDDVPSPQATSVAGRPNGWKWSALVVGGILAAIFLIYTIHRSRKTMLLWFILCIGTASITSHVTLAASSSPIAMNELQKQKLFNSGVNSAYILLQLFSIPSDIDKLANDLNVGVHWENQTSMAAIGTTLRSRGLVVEDSQIQDLDGLLAKAGQDICLLKKNINGIDNYLVILTITPSSVLIVKPGVENRWVQRDQLELYRKSYAGECLLIRHNVGKKLDDKVYSLEGTINFDAGNIRGGQGLIDIPLQISNRSSFPLHIESMKGNCGCFRGVRFSHTNNLVLASGSGDTMNITFDKQEFPSGAIFRSVYLHVNDGQSRDVILNITGTVIRDLKSEVAWLPESIDFGLMSLNDLEKVSQRLAILLPASEVVKTIKCSSDQISLDVHQTSGTTNPADVSSRVEHEYDVKLHNVHFGDFKGNVHFNVEGTLPMEFDIPVKGTIR